MISIQFIDVAVILGLYARFKCYLAIVFFSKYKVRSDADELRYIRLIYWKKWPS